MKPEISFIDLQAQRSRINNEINSAINNVLKHGQFIMGPEVNELEKVLQNYTGAKHCITCANGTDAIQIALMSIAIKPGDQVFLPSFTFTATAEAIVMLGAEPVFVDVVEDSFNICTNDLIHKIAKNEADKPGKQRAIIAVDLFGNSANYKALHKIARDNSMYLIADAAQSFGATSASGMKVGNMADITTTSFFPAKPLGCYGDGGALFTTNDNLAKIIKSIRSHGKGEHKYDNTRVGVNSRLDTLQAAILLQKINILDSEIETRAKNANQYNEALKRHLKTPLLGKNVTHAWAQYTLRSEHRDHIVNNLKIKNIPTAIYYPKPIHLQPAYKKYGEGYGSLPISEKLSQTVFSIPIHAYLNQQDKELICETILDSLPQSQKISAN
ncbi:DegT/DnrJ/EryC1/StrS family aminotransferase [Kiloniella litopenaei]|uniref:DegT/DnrJ/EryC1/StrS family aminotransferase n=1 Tax=Kiloniella litopenaei TaxID=1549748 RepID=UPI003BAC4BBA